MTHGVESDPWVGAQPRARMPRALVWTFAGCAVLVLLAFGATIAFFGYVGASPTPGTSAEAEHEIEPAVLADMRADGLIEEGERVLYLYSSALFHVREGAAFFTDRRVVAIPSAFEERAGERIEARYDEIAELEFEPAAGALDDSAIHVLLHDGSTFTLVVGDEAGGDVAFERALRAQWSTRANVRPAEARSGDAAEELRGDDGR